MSFCLKTHCQSVYNDFINTELPLLSISFWLQLYDLLIIMRQVSSLKADQLELTSACFSSFRLMKPLRSVSTVWNHWYASGLTPGGILPTERKIKSSNRKVKKVQIDFEDAHHCNIVFFARSCFHHCFLPSICRLI